MKHRGQKLHVGCDVALFVCWNMMEQLLADTLAVSKRRRTCARC